MLHLRGTYWGRLSPCPDEYVRKWARWFLFWMLHLRGTYRWLLSPCRDEYVRKRARWFLFWMFHLRGTYRRRLWPWSKAYPAAGPFSQKNKKSCYRTPMPTEAMEHPEIERYIDAMWMEKGLSDNTLSSYRRDLRQFNDWLGKNKNSSVIRADRAQLQAYLGARLEQGQSQRSTARFMSCARGFYKYLLREGTRLASRRGPRR